MKDKQLSENFWLSEFGYVEPLETLLFIIQEIRTELNSGVSVTDGPRTFKEHVDIYKKEYGDKWEEKIAWDSKHLPCFETTKLRAVDISSEGCTGLELAGLARDIAMTHNIHIGLGIGQNFIHIHINKDYTPKPWYYSY